MAIQSQGIGLNIVPGGIIPVVHATQYDVGRVFEFGLLDGNVTASIPSGTTVKVEGTKPSRHAFSYGSPVATISGNVVTVSTADQMTAEAGSVECKLVLTYNSQVIGTAMFILECEVAGVQDDVDISDTVLPTYMEAGRQNMLNAEAWAKGTKDGTAVGSGEPQYHNNAKYWNDQTGAYATAAQTARSGAESAASQATASMVNSRAYEVDSQKYARISKSWATYSNNYNDYGHDWDNSQYWCDRSSYYYDKSRKLYDKMTEKIDSILAVLRLLITSIHITTQDGDRLLTQSGDALVIDFAEKLYLTSEDGYRLLTQNGNNIILSR